MDNSFQTSFIPKKPIIASDDRKERTSIGLFGIFAIIILIAVLLASGGLFFYKDYLSNKRDSLSSSLSSTRDNFDEKTIKELDTYSKRAISAKSVLNNHIVISPLFRLIEDITIPQIQYTKFDHSSDKDVFKVKMSGVSKDYKSIALQADMFNNEKNGSFKNVIFSNLTREFGENVNFDVEFSVDPSLLSYEKNILTGKIIDTPTEPQEEILSEELINTPQL